MLDEEEYLIAQELYGQAIRDEKFYNEREQRFKSLLDYYKKLTDFDET